VNNYRANEFTPHLDSGLGKILAVNPESVRERGALILAALLTRAMGVDDIFMLHDRVYPKLYLSEPLLYALYFGAIGIIVFRFYRQLARSTLVGIAITVLFWGLGAGLDQFFNHVGGQLAEEGSKFIGIAVWAAAWICQAHLDVIRLAGARTKLD
jgi:hypothetical protein